MAKELKKKRDEAKQAWENATVVMKKAKKPDDFTGSKKAHDEAEKLRVEYLKAEKVSKPIPTARTRLLSRRTGDSEEVILLKSVLSRIRHFLEQFVEMKCTSVPYWRAWRDF